jgi:hypothetical protein
VNDRHVTYVDRLFLRHFPPPGLATFVGRLCTPHPTFLIMPSPRSTGSCPSGLDTGRRLDLPLSLRRRRFIITCSVVTVETIIGLENVLDHTEGFKASFDRERGRDPGMYYLRVFGEPGKLASSTNEVPRGTSRPLTTA